MTEGVTQNDEPVSGLCHGARDGDAERRIGNRLSRLQPNNDIVRCRRIEQFQGYLTTCNPDIGLSYWRNALTMYHLC